MKTVNKDYNLTTKKMLETITFYPNYDLCPNNDLQNFAKMRKNFVSNLKRRPKKRSSLGIYLRYFDFFPKKVVISKQNFHVKL